MEIGVFSEGRADGADEVVFCFANVEGAEVDSMLGFRDFVLGRVSGIGMVSVELCCLTYFLWHIF